MRTLTARDMIQTLDGVPTGTSVFVSYLPGKPPTERAIREATRSTKQGISNRHFFGTLASSPWRTSDGDIVFTVLCDNRDDERRGTQDGYRTFNPNLGQLLTLEVL